MLHHDLCIFWLVTSHAIENMHAVKRCCFAVSKRKWHDILWSCKGVEVRTYIVIHYELLGINKRISLTGDGWIEWMNRTVVAGVYDDWAIKRTGGKTGWILKCQNSNCIGIALCTMKNGDKLRFDWRGVSWLHTQLDESANRLYAYTKLTCVFFYFFIYYILMMDNKFYSILIYYDFRMGIKLSPAVRGVLSYWSILRRSCLSGSIQHSWALFE